MNNERNGVSAAVPSTGNLPNDVQPAQPEWEPSDSCERCHELLHIPSGYEPTRFCNDCAGNRWDDRARVINDAAAIISKHLHWPPQSPKETK